MMSKWWNLFPFVLFVTSFSSKSFCINICPTREVTLSSGNITSPNYPSYYYNNINCTLTIRAPSGFSFNFTFTKLDLEFNSSGGCYDYVKISGIFWKDFCNENTPFNFYPGGNVVTVQMYSDSSFTKNGFRLQFVRYFSNTTLTPTPTNTVCNDGLGTASCPWHNEKTSDDFDWSIGRGSTSSSNTGPSKDSKGSINGKYFFIETSSPRKQGDKAWLVSQSFFYSRKCLIFYYHMYGNNIGSLNVYRKIYGSKYKVWSKSGNQGNTWFKAQVNVNSLIYSYKIIIEGVRGSGFKGDIAVDDIELKDGYCNVQSMTPLYSLTAVPTGQRTYAQGCTFQNGLGTTSCPWRNINYDGYSYDDFDWTVGSGSTNSYYTGPGFDKYNSAFGKYAYMDASSQRRRNKAWLFSDYFNSSTTCFRFSYYNYDTSGGLLKVYQQILRSRKRWKWTATQKSRAFKWFDVNITLPHTGFNSAYRIIVEGIKGSGYYVNIAVDEFTFTSGACAILTACDDGFGTASCPWHNAKTSDDFDWSIGSGSTSSSNTGPSKDSKGSSSGNYFFIETSSPRQQGDKAWLVSQSFFNSRKCLTFYYHMYGNDIGSLNVYRKIYGNKYSAWSKSGNQGNAWLKAQVYVDGIYYTYKIIIEGVRGSGFEGDIAVDDIELKGGYCNVQSTTPLYSLTTVPTWQRTYARGCTFQYGMGTRNCPWRNVAYDGYTYDDFDWTVGSGSINPYYTGPGFDKNNSAFGKYAYMEASSQRRGDKAWLVSDYFKSSTTCFRFSYYSYDISGGLLKVYQQILGNTKTLKWTATPKSRAFKWFDVNITLPNTGFNSAYRIIVEGIKGSGYYVNIAVDEFTFTTGACDYVSLYPTTVCDDGMTASCPWHNEKTSDDFDWSIGRGSTSSSNTGPSTDSKGSIYGKYFFLETSSPRQQGDKAWLVSQSFSYSRKCLTFYYHMYGNHIGSLNVYRQIYGNEYKVWSKSGNQGNSWSKAQVDVNGVFYNYKIIIEGVRGSGFKGDISVDDIELKDGYCNVQSTTPLYSLTTVPTWQRTYARGCTFQYGMGTRNCPWRNVAYDGYTYDDFDWTVGSGSTNPYYTGPGFDKYNSSFGKYAYMEASSQRRGDKAWLVSDYFKSSTTCFRFSYYSYNTSVGLLKVYQQILGNTKTLKWTATPKSRAFKWFDVNITLPRTGFNSAYRLIVEGIKGSGYYVNIAVDDFTFTTGACDYVPLYPTTDARGCTFQYGMGTRNCPWRNVAYDGYTYDDFDWTVGSGSTNPNYTGPGFDKYNSSFGKYAYMEASSQRRGDKAWLVSDYFKSSTTCFRFSYYNYDISGGLLNVYQQILGSRRKLQWSKTDRNSEFRWFDVSITLPYTGFNSDYRIIVEGIEGSGYYVNIAVDEFTFTTGACTTSTASNENESYSTRNIAIISGASGGLLLLLVIGMVIIYYVRQKNRQRSSTSSTTQPGSAQNPTHQTNQQNTMTGITPPSYENVCNTSPFYINATPGFTNHGVIPHLTPAENLGQNVYTVPMTAIISGNNSNANPKT
ncbi:MAM and LDL-receptor class A domain-containing protein 1-like isoform X2 [Xenia sp. Carnegie-2017]|uniref:MAM and LDL-receptor class A domain-containing protein 1-like isoform X2 n=1 Tax=Xenia sp. Carnegie-2017 TaxID=2897299 RepID=UPI001F03EB6E|nr:MAM and LDL-receptor class A domain-containing protein 1-like isoform X2 [Xenia sp. Carnegie-2017]